MNSRSTLSDAMAIKTKSFNRFWALDRDRLLPSSTEVSRAYEIISILPEFFRLVTKFNFPNYRIPHTVVDKIPSF